MNNPSQEIKERIDIVDFLRGYIELKPAGKNFKANCPFHKEKSPSFMVSPDRQSWHCFGCNTGGDIFAFLMRYENLEFFEALKVLAEKAGVELRKISLADQRQFGVLYDINAAAQTFYTAELQKSAVAQKYLAERNLSGETIKEFGVGFAPGGGEALVLYLIKSGYSAADIVRAGLVIKSDAGTLFDRFRNRVMFPLYNHFGKVVGFTGRILPQYDTGEFGKYVNSPETPIFNKSKILYGFHKSKNYIREEGAAILVEGQMDFLMSWQDGVKNITATSGTALTVDHLKNIQRLTSNLILVFDSDEAGLAAGERAIDLAEAADLNTKVLILKDFKDPAEAVAKQSGILKTLISQATPAMEFYFERYLPKSFLEKGDNVSLKKNIRAVLAKIINLQSFIDQSHWIHNLSERVGYDEKVLLEEMEALPKKVESTANQNPAVTNEPLVEVKSRHELITELIISVALAKNDLKGIAGESVSYFPLKYQEAFKFLLGEKSEASPQIEELANRIIIFSGLGPEEDVEELKRQLKSEYLNERRLIISKMIAEAERKGDDLGLEKAMRLFDETLKEINNSNQLKTKN